MESLVPQDTCVVDDNIYATESINRSLDDGITVLSGGLDTDSFAAQFLDLVDNIVGVRKVVDYDSSSMLGKCQTVRTADTVKPLVSLGITMENVLLTQHLHPSRGQLVQRGQASRLEGWAPASETLPTR